MSLRALVQSIRAILESQVRDSSGRYDYKGACDFCGKSAGDDYMTDDEVCGSTDGPGFYLCDRAPCVKARDNLSVEERRAAYTKRRAATILAQNAKKTDPTVPKYAEQKKFTVGTRVRDHNKNQGTVTGYEKRYILVLWDGEQVGVPVYYKKIFKI